MHDMERIEIRLLSESDISAAMKLKESAGWNQTENDWRCLLKLEPDGCFGAMLNGQLVGTTTTTTYGNELAWIGMVLVQPEKRRLGIATKLLNTALDYLSQKVATIKLDATPAGRPVYEKLGFQVEGLIERWSGIGIPTKLESNSTFSVVDVDDDSRRDLLALDRRAFNADRSKLINILLNNACATALAKGEDGSLNGYALTRHGSNAEYVGPVVTTSPEQVIPLLNGVVDQLKGQRLYIDFNSACGIGPTVLIDRGFVKERELIRMRFGTVSESTSRFVFAIAGPEVG